MENERTENIIYLDLKHVHNGHRKCGGRKKKLKEPKKKNKKKKKVGKPIGIPLGGGMPQLFMYSLTMLICY